jgi:hypothetical protein
VIIILLANFVPRSHARVGYVILHATLDRGRSRCCLASCLRKTDSHCATTATTGEWATLICRMPVSAKLIMVTAPMNMQIAMNWLLRSLIETKARRWKRRAPPTKGEVLFYPIGGVGTSEPVKNSRTQSSTTSLFRHGTGVR